MGRERQKRWGNSHDLLRTAALYLSTSARMPASSPSLGTFDSQRCLIVGPSTDVARQMIGYKRLSLTDIKVDIGRGAKAKSVSAAWTAADVEGKWASSAWGKTLAARKAKAEAGDFERFTDMVSHKKAMKATRKALK